MPFDQKEFSMTGLLVLLAVLLVGLAAIFFFSWRDRKRLEKKNKPKVMRIPPVVNAKLDLDVSEEFYHK